MNMQPLIDALAYADEQAPLNDPEQDDSELITIEVTAGWVREVREALKSTGFVSPIRAQSYTCVTRTGLEYGYAFKHSDSDDSVFEIRLGESPNAPEIEAALEAFAARAQIIADALNGVRRFKRD